MTRFIVLFGLCFTFNAANVSACSCTYQGPFLQMAKETPLVGLFKVTKFLTFKNIQDTPTPMSMEVEMIYKYKGKETRKNVIVWGDPGNLCRPYLSNFKESQYYVIALSAVGKKTPEEKDTHYFISVCGAYWLNVNFTKSTVTGDIDSKNESSKTISLNELRLNLLKLQNLTSYFGRKSSIVV